jgi:hypothetical protein
MGTYYHYTTARFTDAERLARRRKPLYTFPVRAYFASFFPTLVSRPFVAPFFLHLGQFSFTPRT